MDKDAESLQNSIKQYEIQLSQIRKALASNESEEERGNLLCLEKDLVELISLTTETYNTVKESTSKPSNSDSDDQFSAEYALFQAELAELEEDKSENSDAIDSNSSETKQNLLELQEELSALKGTKCQAPYSQQWQRADTSSSQGLHNALIVDVEMPKDVEDLSHLQVRVLFVNPTEKQMLPCPFYLEGECRFSDEKCNFSHGEVVAFSDIGEYKEPDFTLVKEGSLVLAKQNDSLWHRARVKEIVNDCKVTVQFETKSHESVELDLHDVLPLCGMVDSVSSDDSSDSDSDSDRDSEMTTEAPSQDFFVNMSLTRTPSTTKLGQWEKHTKAEITKKTRSRNICSFSGCKRSKARFPSLRFFKFPVDRPAACDLWIQNCKNEVLDRVTKKTLNRRVVCEKHFENDCFMNALKSRLHPCAWPTLSAVDDDDVETPVNQPTSSEPRPADIAEQDIHTSSLSPVPIPSTTDTAAATDPTITLTTSPSQAQDVAGVLS